MTGRRHCIGSVLKLCCTKKKGGMETVLEGKSLGNSCLLVVHGFFSGEAGGTFFLGGSKFALLVN